MDAATCQITGREFPPDELVPLSAIRPRLLQMIQQTHPEVSEQHFISAEELNKFRAQYVRGVIADEVGEVTALESEVVRSMQEHELISEHVDREFETNLTFGERVADKIASFGGSWTFIISFGGFLAAWIAVNTVILAARPPDPYPFILLNLILSALASIQAPVIMMSQNRQEAKDRVRSEHDYKVNLKAELEIRHLHEKMDHLLKQQAQRLLEIQQIQIELLEEVLKKSTPASSAAPSNS
ncbi:MAG: DUF1003 domain-containing protein [Chthoniobacter sp.]|nr:DUF1003 domain-containing protein [Chthoniobacter sp.]